MANEYGDLEQMVNDVTSLDTARMTLRWALERLNNIEKEKADLKKNLTIAEEAAKRLQVKEATLTDAYSSRTKTLEEKEDFYTKLEATMSLLGEGKLDIQQLLKKEAKLDSLRHSLESEYSDKFEELDRNQRSVIERWNGRLLEVESQYAARLAEAQKKYDGLRAELEGDYQGRINSLQASFKSREKYLSERIGGLEGSVRQSEEKVETRRRELESEYLAKKRETEENYRKLKNMLEAGLEEKIRSADSDHAEQVRAFEASWQIERARLLEEQHVREAQYASAQDRIKEIENALALQQETHHSELLKIISEKETAFRAQLVALENEKDAKEATVRELQARLDKKAAAWDADRARLEADFDSRMCSLEAAQKEHAASLESEYAAKKGELDVIIAASRGEFEKEFNARLQAERQSMEVEKTILEQEKRAREEALAVNTERLREVENALSATREEHHKDLMERIRTGEASFREKLAGFESEKQAYNETINNLTDELRRRESALIEEKNKIAAEYGAKSAILGEMLARTEAAFEEKRRAYEEKIAALSAGLEEAAKASAMEKENFQKELARVSANVQALAEERTALIRADYESRKADLETEFAARYNDRLKALEAEKARVNEALAESERQREFSNAKAAELDAAMAELRRNDAEEKAALSRDYAARLAAARKTAEEDAKVREAELRADIKIQSENLTAELSKAADSARVKEEELAARLRAEYESRKADLEKEFAARYSDRLKALEAEKARVKEELAENESSLAETKAAAAAIEADYAALRERLESEAAGRIAAVQSEAAGKMEFERKNWNAERSRFENMLAETSERFHSSQKEIETLNSKLHQAALESAGCEDRFNGRLLEAKSNYEKELFLRVKESVDAQTADLVAGVEAANAKLADLSAVLETKENVINGLRAAAIEAKSECEARVISSVSESVAARRSELEQAYARRQAALEEDSLARRKELTEEFTLRSVRLAEENAALKADLEKKTAAASEAGSRAAALADKLLAAEKAFHDEKLEMQKAQIREFDSAVGASVSEAVEMSEQRLRHAQEELEKAKKTNREEVRQLEEAFAGEKDRLLEEVDRRDRYIESADSKLQELEREMIAYRQTATGELMKNISDQDTRFREMAAEDKARSDARVKQLESLLSAKEKLLADSDRFYRQKQLELDSLHAGLNIRVNGFNEAIFAQKQELGEKEKALNEYRLKLEREYALKTSELEQMKAELTRAIMDYRKK